MAASGGPPNGGAAPLAREPPRPATDRFTQGVLLRHGAAAYEFQVHGEPSYFITLRTERGEQTLWSRELKRALVESKTQPRIGESIGVRQNGIDPVTFVHRERKARGEVVTEKRLDTPRGQWIVEKQSFFDERALAAQALRDPRVSRREAIRSHPDLAGAYWALDSARKVAETRIEDPESRLRFVALVRETLAHSLERGEAPPATPSPGRHTEPVRDRTSEHTR